MATTTETKIIEIKIPIGEGIKQIQLLTAEIERLRAGQAELKNGTEAQRQQYEKNAITIKEYTRQKAVLQREVQTEIKDTQSAMSAYQKLQTEYTKAAANAKNLAAAHGVGSEKAKAAADAALKLGDELKEIDSSVGQNQRRVGDYAGELGKLPGIFGKVAGGSQNLGASFTMLKANPLFAILSVVVSLFTAISNAMGSGTESGRKLQQVMAPLNDLFKGLVKVMADFFSVILSGASAVAKFAGEVLSFIPAIDKMNKAGEESIRIEKEKQRLIREGMVDKAADAKEELRISELKKKIMQADKYSVEQRLAFAREVDKAEKALALDDANRANNNLKNFLENMRLQGKAQKDFSNEEMQQLVDLQTAKYAEQQKYYDNTRRTASREATLIAEIEKEKEAAGKASFEKLKQQQEEFTAKKKADEEKRLADLRAYIANQSGIINEQIAKYKKDLTPKEASLLDKVTKDATEVLNASITKNNAIVASDKEATDAQIANAERLKQAKLQGALDTANAGADILQGAFDFTNALAEAELATWAKQNKGKANFDQEYAKKRAELEHKAAVRNKVMQVVNSLINTAAAVVAQLSVPGAGPALAIAAGIAGALQTAAIIATPIPDKNSTSVPSGGAAASSAPDLTSKMASPLTNSVQTMQSTGGSNAITSGAANAAISPAFDYNAMAKVMSNLPAPELSIVELRTKERQVDFIDNVSTLKS